MLHAEEPLFVLRLKQRGIPHFVRNDNERYFSRADPARTDEREDFIGAGTSASRERPHFFPVGTFWFNSSNQFSTTLICVGAACACSMGLSIRKRWPSGETS